MPRNVAVRAGLAILGVVIALVWWTLKKDSGSPHETVSTIPQKIWDGGGPVTWDVPVELDGKLPVAFVGQLTALGKSSGKK